MITKILYGMPALGTCASADQMYRDRRRVFVDLLRWDLTVVDHAFEIDQFDTERAVYILALDADARHIGSIRLLPTDGPHLLGDIFPDLCADAVPKGCSIWEISRGCLSPTLARSDRLAVRDGLTMAAVQFALERGITSYSCIADGSWLRQIPLLGWACEPLGQPRLVGKSCTGALRVDITADTPSLLEQTRRSGPVGSTAPTVSRLARTIVDIAA